jgi:RNA polymerase sigma-70 factor, ECF subfamily
VINLTATSERTVSDSPLSGGSPLSDGRQRALIERASRGDPAAFAALVGPRFDRLARTAAAILGQDADAADAVQEALIRAWQGLPGLRDPDQFDPWLTRIVVNACRTALSRRSRVRIREINLDPDDPTERHSPAGGPGPDAVLARLELESAFNRLSPDERTILVLHHLDGRSIEQIALVLAIPAGTAKSRLFSARRALERALGSPR